MSKARVLVADDSVTIQKVFELAFEGEDIDIMVASDGKAALSMAMREKPDMIIADVNMPEMDGFELCQAVKKNTDTKPIPVYLLSSALDEFDEDKAQKAGASGKFEKPFRSEDMVRQVLDVISSPHEEKASAPAPGLDDSFEEIDVSLDGILESFDSSEVGETEMEEALKSAWDEVEEDRAQKTIPQPPYARMPVPGAPGASVKILDLTDNLAGDMEEGGMDDDLDVETLTGSETELELAEYPAGDSAFQAFADEEEPSSAIVSPTGVGGLKKERMDTEEDLSEEARAMLRAIDDEREISPEPPPVETRPAMAAPARPTMTDDAVSRAVKAAIDELDSSALETALRAAVTSALMEKITPGAMEAAVKSALKEMSPLFLETFKKIVEEVTLDVAETLVRQTIDQIKSGE